MKAICAVLLFAANVIAHSGVSWIEIDGTKYPPWDARIDPLLGEVKRIQWAYSPAKSFFGMNPLSAQFGPVTNVSSAAIACGPNAKAPALKAVARAGSSISVTFSHIIQMHRGPVISWLGYLPTPETPITQVKFFKVDAPSYDAKTQTWANERIARNNMTHTFQIPSDIKPGTYVMRTELLALHGNTPSMQVTPVSGPEFYLHCFNIDVIGSGTVTPEGATFPGAYTRGEPGLSFSPHYGDGSGVEKNSKYVTPGPSLYQGKHDNPSGPVPVVKETGAYSGVLNIKYVELKEKLDVYGGRIIALVNKAWPANKEFKSIAWDYAMMQMSPEMRKAYTEYEALKPEIEAFRKAVQAA